MIIFLKKITQVFDITNQCRESAKLTSFSSHFCSAPTNVFPPLYWQSSSFTVPSAPCKHSSFWMLCLISWRVENSKYYSKGNKIFFFLSELYFSQSEIKRYVLSLTWFPPSPWHGYMISCFPPSLFSPTSRQESLPTFFTYREREEGVGEQWEETKWKTNIQCKLFKQLQPLECFQWCQIGTVQDPLEIPSGNPQRLDRALRFGKSWAGGEVCYLTEPKRSGLRSGMKTSG